MTILPATYLTLSAAVGAAQVADAVILWRVKGRVMPLLICFSVFEYFWACVSIAELRDRSSPTPDWLPLSFVGWIAFGLLVGLIGRYRNPHPMVPPAIPRWSVLVGGVFGAYFCIASLVQVLGEAEGN